MPGSTATAGLLLALSAALGFSAKAIFVKLAYSYGADALSLLALRMLFALPAFLFVAVRSSRGARPLQAGEYLGVAVLGVVGYYASSYLDFLGLQWISAGLERLILFTYPTLTLLIAVVFLRRAWSWRDVAGLLVSWLGIAVVFMQDLQLAQDWHAVWLGGGLVLASALAYAIYLTGCGQMLTRIGSQHFTALAMCVSTLATLLHFFATRPAADLLQPMPVLGLSLGMAVFSTVLPVFALSAAIRRLGAARTAIVGTAGPVLTILLAAVFLDEPITLIQLAGTLLVLAGIALARERPQRGEAKA